MLFADVVKGEREGVGEGLAGIQDLYLTDEQVAKIGDIAKACRPKVEEAGKEVASAVREELEKVHGALTPEQKEKVLAQKDERAGHQFDGLVARIAYLSDLDLTDHEFSVIEGMQRQSRPRLAKVVEELGRILTDEQKKAHEEMVQAGKKRGDILAALKLTDEQKGKMDLVGKKLNVLVRGQLESIREILNAEQGAHLREIKTESKDRTRIRDRWAARITTVEDLNLTAAQRAQILEIRKEYRPKVNEAGNKLRAAIAEELDRVLAVLLEK